MDQANQAPSAWIKNRSMRLFLYSPKQNTEKFIGDVLTMLKMLNAHNAMTNCYLKPSNYAGVGAPATGANGGRPGS